MPPYHHALVAWAMQIYRFDRVGTVPAVYGPHVVWCTARQLGHPTEFQGPYGEDFWAAAGTIFAVCVRAL